MQFLFVLCGLGLIGYAAYLTALIDDAIQQIYQLIAFTSGLNLLAIVGVWAAIDGAKGK